MTLTHLRAWYARHRLFILILLLFVSFRLLAALLFRPGGFIADFSDYDFYMEWGRLTPRGYAAYDNLWTAYPPLFPALMLPLFELSARIPPWVDPRLAFHTLLAAALLVFETGNLVLIYRLGGKLGIGDRGSGIGERGLGTGDWGLGTGERGLASGERGTETGERKSTHHAPRTMPPISQSPNLPIPNTQYPITPPLLYALLFAPVYTLLGWFEPMPLFFMLLGLDLLLGRGRWGWVGSGVAAALGFLTKLTPALLVPIAVRWLGSRLSLAAARREWFNPRSAGNLLRPTLYALIFFGVVVGVGYPFVRANPALAFSSFQVQAIRPPWQSLWAVLDGYFGYGLVPLDMRNLAGLAGPLWQSSLPWPWITGGFGLLYLWLYTRPYDWRNPRTAIAFAGVSVIWLFLYSKGWSPQFVVWVLAFIVLLMPNLHGVVVAIGLMVGNFIEANVFLILLPDEHWIMVGTVLVRTVLLMALAGIFLGQIWPGKGRRWLAGISRGVAWASVAAGALALLIAAPAAGRAYGESRFSQHPCRESIELLRAEAAWPGSLLITEQSEAWEQFYPWLRAAYTLRVLDDYSVDGGSREDPAAVKARRLAALVAEQAEFWWLAWGDDGPSWPDLPHLQSLETFAHGPCTLTRLAVRPAAPLAAAQVTGGPIHLLDARWQIAPDPETGGATLHLLLYWQADAAVGESYTVFTQLFNPAGEMVAQQDNLPVTGLAPTETWSPGRVIRDPYRLALPAQADEADYRLIVGLYTGPERQPFTLADGAVERFVSFPIER